MPHHENYLNCVQDTISLCYISFRIILEMRFILSILILIAISVGSYFYYENRRESLKNNPWTGVWTGSVPGVPAFSEGQRDYFKNNLVTFSICGYSKSNLAIRSLSKIFPSDLPKIKYYGVKDYYVANFKGKNQLEINTALTLNHYTSGDEIKVTVLDNGKVFMLKDTSFYLKKTNQPVRCFLRRGV